ncbi:transposable element Tcb2 transposase [Trichonephila clavipes]|nr:transposable element Tcb2 transposase [Trichonephila clavipes]
MRAGIWQLLPKKTDSTASDLTRQLSSAIGTTVSRQTVYRRLGHIGLYARRPVRCIPLTATHCHLRLTWSREHALWTPQQCSCVMFSDESRFSVQSDSRRTLIWSSQSTRCHQENPIERHRYGGAGWLVWGGIILGSGTDLHVQSVTMTGHIYWDVILEQHVPLFRGAMCAEFLFMDDNARPHRANNADECFQWEDITRIDWPAYSPDLNQIQHVWDIPGLRIANLHHLPTCVPELWSSLLDEWCNILQDHIDNLILSLPRRFALRKFRTLKGLRKGPLTAKILRLMVSKFEETGSLNVPSGRGKKPVSTEAIEKLTLQVEEDKASNVQASTSVRFVAEALGLPRATVQKIMRNILRYYPYKLQFVQELLPHDFETRHLFSLQFLARLEVDPEWPWNILWTDEARFHLDGSVNTPNCRIWETDNPHSTLRVPLHSSKVTVWLCFSASFYSWPVFFKELGAGGPVTCSVTGQRYASLLRNKIIPDLQARQCLSRIIFMQDGAPPHITRCVTDVLKHHFTEESVIHRQFHHLWPPLSPDLNPCDFWLCGHLKQLVSCDQPKTLPDLRDSISRHVLNISQNTLRSTVGTCYLKISNSS